VYISAGKTLLPSESLDAVNFIKMSRLEYNANI
jgi:hypothetical protein